MLKEAEKDESETYNSKIDEIKISSVEEGITCMHRFKNRIAFLDVDGTAVPWYEVVLNLPGIRSIRTTANELGLHLPNVRWRNNLAHMTKELGMISITNRQTGNIFDTFFNTTRLLTDNAIDNAVTGLDRQNAGRLGQKGSREKLFKRIDASIEAIDKSKKVDLCLMSDTMVDFKGLYAKIRSTYFEVRSSVNVNENSSLYNIMHRLKEAGKDVLSKILNEHDEKALFGEQRFIDDVIEYLQRQHAIAPENINIHIIRLNTSGKVLKSLKEITAQLNLQSTEKSKMHPVEP